MKWYDGTAVALILTLTSWTNPLWAANASNADVVQLRTSCTTPSGTTLDNCFTDMPTLNTWIWNTRLPSAVSPLLVQIGPGTFPGIFNCTNSGYVSLDGAGIGTTVLQATGAGGPINVSNCTELKFSRLTVTNLGINTLLGINWQGGGHSVWTNVEADMQGYAWFEGAGSGCQWTPGQHDWFNSRIVVTPDPLISHAVGYYATCDKSWFFGSEITAVAHQGTPSPVTPIWATGGEVHVYGGVIRALTDPGVTTNNIIAVQADNNGMVHIHGTGIDVSSAAGNNIKALSAATGAMIHANASAYMLQTGTGGTITRISNNGGMIMAPYQWEEGPTPPMIQSANGSDTAVLTNTTDGQPHLLIYSTNCQSKWYDTAAKNCY